MCGLRRLLANADIGTSEAMVDRWALDSTCYFAPNICSSPPLGTNQSSSSGPKFCALLLHTGVSATNKRPAARRIPLALPIGGAPLRGLSAAGLSLTFGGASCAEAEHDLAPSRPVFFPLPRRQCCGVPGTKHHRRTHKHHRRTLRPQADAGSRAETLEREGGRSAIASEASAIVSEVPEEGQTARRPPA
jgi:hypothetical protein